MHCFCHCKGPSYLTHHIFFLKKALVNPSFLCGSPSEGWGEFNAGQSGTPKNYPDSSRFQIRKFPAASLNDKYYSYEYIHNISSCTYFDSMVLLLKIYQVKWCEKSSGQVCQVFKGGYRSLGKSSGHLLYSFPCFQIKSRKDTTATCFCCIKTVTFQKHLDQDYLDWKHALQHDSYSTYIAWSWCYIAISNKIELNRNHINVNFHWNLEP